MKGDLDVIKQLNQVLTLQLTGINQLFLHSRMHDDWGYKDIAKQIYSDSIHLMKAAQKLTDRILFLEGLPNYQKILKLHIGEAAQECLENDYRFSCDLREKLIEAIELCLGKKDHHSRDILDQLLKKQEGIIDWHKAQKQLIDQIGKENYLSQKL